MLRGGRGGVVGGHGVRGSVDAGRGGYWSKGQGGRMVASYLRIILRCYPTETPAPVLRFDVIPLGPLNLIADLVLPLLCRPRRSVSAGKNGRVQAFGDHCKASINAMVYQKFREFDPTIDVIIFACALFSLTTQQMFRSRQQCSDC